MAPAVETKGKKREIKAGTKVAKRKRQKQARYLATPGSAVDHAESNYELLQCQTYQNVYQQPYRIYFTFEVQMLMMVHAYLSKNEVIGILAG